MNQYKVCIDARRTDKGGIWRVTRELQRALATMPNARLVSLVPAAAAQAEETGDVIPFAAPLLSMAEYERLPTILRDAEVDIYVAPQFYTPPRVPAPIVTWVHDTWPVTHPEWLPPIQQEFARRDQSAAQVAKRLLAEYAHLRRQRALFPDNVLLGRCDEQDLAPLERMVVAMFALNLDRAAAVVTCSEFSRHEIQALFPEVANKIHVIYNPIPHLGVPPQTHVGLAGPRRLLHVSKWEPRKNLPRLIRAFSLAAAQVRDVELHLVGEAVTPDEERRVLDTIRVQPFANQIVRHRNPSDRELSQLYGSATALVMPSLYEGFSLPIVEAFTHGLPVVASRAGAIPEIAGAAALLFEPEDECEIAAALIKLLRSDDLVESLRTAGRRRVTELSAHDFAADVAAVLNRVAE